MDALILARMQFAATDPAVLAFRIIVGVGMLMVATSWLGWRMSRFQP